VALAGSRWSALGRRGAPLLKFRRERPHRRLVFAKLTGCGVDV